MQRKGVLFIDLQVAAALIATFIKRGQGKYSAVNSAPPSPSREGDDYGFEDYENENDDYHTGYGTGYMMGNAQRRKPKAFFKNITYSKEETHVYYK